jgi:hypothetical protein
LTVNRCGRLLSFGASDWQISSTPLAAILRLSELDGQLALAVHAAAH